MQTERLIRLPEVIAMTGLGRSAIYKAIAGECPQLEPFPRPIKLGRVSVWSLLGVLEWIESRKAEQQ